MLPSAGLWAPKESVYVIIHRPACPKLSKTFVISNGKATYVIMQLYAQQTLIIDGTVAGGPLFALFNEAGDLESFLDLTSFLKAYPPDGDQNQTWESVKVLAPALDVQYFPSEVYESNLKDSFSKYLLDDGVSPAASVTLKKPAVTALYREKHYGLNEVFRLFPEAQTFIVAPLVLAWVATELVHSESSLIHIHQAADQVCMTVFNQGNFTFQKEFQCANDDEFNYYLIRVLALSDQHASNLKVSISGDLVEGDSWYVRIAKYVKHIEFADIQNMYKVFYADHWRKT